MIFAPRVSQDPSPTPALQPGRGVTPSSDQTGPQLERLGSAAMTAGAGAVEVQNYVDRAKADEGDNQLQDHYAKLLQDPSNGYLTKVGGNAVDARQATVDELNSSREAISNNMATGYQRQLFAQRSSQRLREAMSRVDTHFTAEAKSFSVGQKSAKRDAAVRDAISSSIIGPPRPTQVGPAAASASPDGEPTTPSVAPPQVDPYEVHKATALALDSQIAKDLGYSKEQEDAMHLATTTKIHTGVVESFVARGNPTQAVNYLKNIKPGEIDPMTATKLQEQVQTASDREQGAHIALDGVKQEPMPPRSDMTYADYYQTKEADLYQKIAQTRQQAFDDLRNGKITEGVLHSILHNLDTFEGSHEKDTNAQKIAAGTQAQQYLSAAWSRGETSANLESLPPELRQRIDALGLTEHIREFARTQGKDTEASVWAVDHAADSDLKGRSEGDAILMFRAAGASDKLINELGLPRWRAANGIGKQGDYDPLSAHQRLVANTPKIFFMHPGKSEDINPDYAPGTAHFASYALYTSAVAMERQQRAAAKGRPLDAEEEQKVYDDLNADVIYTPIGAVPRAAVPIGDYGTETTMLDAKTGAQVPIKLPPDKETLDFVRQHIRENKHDPTYSPTTAEMQSYYNSIRDKSRDTPDASVRFPTSVLRTPTEVDAEIQARNQRAAADRAAAMNNKIVTGDDVASELAAAGAEHGVTFDADKAVSYIRALAKSKRTSEAAALETFRSSLKTGKGGSLQWMLQNGLTK
jgi:hypothetical protein